MATIKEIEEKARRYDEAIEVAQRFYNNSVAITKKGLEDIFPELKESEDERISKNIISWLKNIEGQTIPINDYNSAIAWLEKQGKKELVTCPICGWEIEKQGDQELLVTNVEKNIHPIIVKKTGLGRCAVEHEQKPADKVEPKFKKGEWLVENHPNIYARFLQILEIYNFNGKNNYVVSRDLHNDEDVAECEFIETHWHPFNVKDAKDCDVLRIRNLTFIFQEITKNNVCHKDAVVAYCSYEDNDDGFGVCGPDCITDLEIITPATKEQRDTLMKAMTDAGYTFDFDKKKLKKIEEKSVDKVSLDFKKGDILYEQKTMSILLVYERNGSWLMTFCDYWMLKEKFHVEFPYENYGFVREMSLVHATKEQRDLLFQKMHEAGYEWDSEEKELKKIVAPIFHIGDRVRYKGHACDGVITEITDTDYICGDAKLPISTQDKLELVEQKHAEWSKEDERLLSKLQTYIDLECFDRECNGQELIDWLKSLKDRYTWKPTKEQLDIIDMILTDEAMDDNVKSIIKELKEQLKQL